MTTVAVAGLAGATGASVLAALDSDPAIRRIIGIDPGDPARPSPKLEFHRSVLDAERVSKIVSGADALVCCALDLAPARDEDAARDAAVATMQGLLDAAAAAPVPCVVVVSSAMVYGAHPDNAIPLSEDAPLRANADYGPSLRALAVEEVVRRARRRQADIAIAVLRPAALAGPQSDSFIARMFESPRVPRIKGHVPVLQVLHHDDLAAAVLFACERRVDGEFNVAADGWLSMDEVGSLSGKRSIEMPEAVAFSIAARAWRIGLSSSPPGELRFLMHPPVLSCGRLADAGWRPRHSNRDALLATIEARRPWIALGPGRVRKADLAKGAAATLGLIGAMAAVRRARKRS